MRIGTPTSTWSPDRCSRPAHRWRAGSTCSATEGAFDVDESRDHPERRSRRRPTPRLHAGQLGPGAGIQLAVELGAASVDHCTYASDDDLEALAAPPTPRWRHFCQEPNSPRAQSGRMHDGSWRRAPPWRSRPTATPARYTTSMSFCIAVAVRDMHFTPAQALWSATAGGAAALRRDDVGVLAVGAARRLRPAGRPVLRPPGVPAGRAVDRGRGLGGVCHLVKVTRHHAPTRYLAKWQMPRGVRMIRCTVRRPTADVATGRGGQP